MLRRQYQDPGASRSGSLFVDAKRLHLFDPVTERATHPLQTPGALLASARP
jgi:hypothetical protein